jgi:hypothetical protein
MAFWEKKIAKWSVRVYKKLVCAIKGLLLVGKSTLPKMDFCMAGWISAQDQARKMNSYCFGSEMQAAWTIG